MPPLQLIVHADTPENAARIERALRAGAPNCAIRTVPTAAELPALIAAGAATGIIAAAPESAPPREGMSSALRHELNNHLALIRMLADFLADATGLPPAVTAKAKEIGTAAEAAAQAVRRTKPAG